MGATRKPDFGSADFSGGEKAKKEQVWLFSFPLQETVGNPSGAKEAILTQFFDFSSLSRSVPATDLVMSPWFSKLRPPEIVFR